MKILLWPSQYLPNIGGLETASHGLAKALQEQGHEILVLTSGESPSAFSLDGIQVYAFPLIKPLHDCDLKTMKESLSAIGRLIDAFRPDVANVHGWFEGFSFYQKRIFEKRDIPLCLTVHGLLEQKAYDTEACASLWARAKAVNTVSKGLIAALREAGIDHPNLRTIYNGSRFSASSPSPLSFPPCKLLMAGRLSEEKCFDTAFYAFEQLSPSWPELTLRLIGAGKLYPELRALKETLLFGANIEMPGFLSPSEMRREFDRASLVLIPSSYESFSMVALEAAQRGRPVIASNVLGLKEVVEDGETGLLVEPKDAEALARAIDWTLRNPSKTQEMAKAAFARAKDLFSLEAMAAGYLAMYEEIAL